jgi:hypothetical protein
LEVFEKKNSPKKFGALGDFALAIANHLCAIFPEKKTIKAGLVDGAFS